MTVSGFVVGLKRVHAVHGQDESYTGFRVRHAFCGF